MQIALSAAQIADVVAHGGRYTSDNFPLARAETRAWAEKYGVQEYVDGMIGDEELAGGLLDWLLDLEPTTVDVVPAE
jgi:hypothetical protein